MRRRDNIIKEIENITSSLLNGFIQDGYFQINGVTTSAGISQLNFSDSKFSFDLYNTSLLHFTNFDSTIAIFRSKYLRLSNLNRFADKMELLHSLKMVGEKTERWEKIKNYIFAASFTPKRKEDLNSYEYHWKNYANNGKGFALEFEVIRKPLYPFHFSLNVNYLEDYEELELLKYLNSININDVVLESLVPILASIKRKSFAKEDEVRILYQSSELLCKSDYQTNKDLEFSLSQNNEISFFSKLRFIYQNENNNSDAFMELKAIHIGKNSEINDGQEILLNYLIPELHMHGIKVNWMN